MTSVVYGIWEVSFQNLFDVKPVNSDEQYVNLGEQDKDVCLCPKANY